MVPPSANQRIFFLVRFCRYKIKSKSRKNITTDFLFYLIALFQKKFNKKTDMVEPVKQATASPRFFFQSK